VKNLNDGPDSPINPYAAPSADLSAPLDSQPKRSAVFFGVSPGKVLVMSVLTLGIYDLSFWWRHWRARQRRGERVSVFWRTVFAAFCSFEFKNTLAMSMAERDLPEDPWLRRAPLVYLLSFMLDNLVSRLADGAVAFIAAVLFELVRASALVVIQRSVNAVLVADGNAQLITRGASVRTYLLGCAGILIWMLTIGSYLYPQALQGGG
jgi:hypothetical protein